MRPDVLLEPQIFAPRFRSLLEQLDLAAEARERLLQARLTSVLVSPGSDSLILTLESEQQLPGPALDAARQSLQSHLPSPLAPRLVWDIRYPEGRVGPLDYLSEHWKDLLFLLSRHLPMAQTYLSIVRFENGDKQRVRVIVPNQLAQTALQRAQGAECLGRLLGERIAAPAVPMRIETGDCGEAVQQAQALYRARIQEELERLQAEQDEAPATGAAAGQTHRQLWKPILGRKIASPQKPIAQITEEEDPVVLEGELIAFEEKILRTGRRLVLFDIYDKTGSLSARLFLDAGKSLPPELKLGAYVKTRGAVQFDKYSRDLCLMVKDLAIGEKPVRKDLAAEKRIELHAHTQISAMDALTSVEALIAQAKAFGHPAVAITDHGVVQAYPDAVQAAARHKMKVIFGMEGYLIEDDWGADKAHKPYHISVLVAKPEGVRNLYRLVSEAHLKHFYRHPRIPRSLLRECRAGLLLGTACEQGELFRALLANAPDPACEAIARAYDYLEIMPRGNNRFLLRDGVLPNEESLLDLNRRIVDLGRRLDIPVVATGDVHFLEPGDEVFRSILQAGMGFTDAAQQAPLYFQTTEEMLAEFDYLGPETARAVVIENPQKIADAVEAVQPIKTTFHPPKLPNAERELERLTLSAAKETYGEPLPPAVAQRLQREIKAITGNNFASLFLIARQVVTRSLRDGYLVGSRGSVGSSLTATMLGITEVNPLPGHYLCQHCHEFILPGEGRIGADLPDRNCPKCGEDMLKDGFDIPFEVFMGFKGDKLPDIDLNFSGEYQQNAHKFMEELFDRDHIFKAGTISTVADRIAYGFVKKYLEEHQLVLREAEVNRLARGCAGVKKTTGQHPGGIMIVPQDMDIFDFTPIQRPADDRDSDIITTHFDYHAIHDSLIKLDLLGHDDPTSLRRLGDWTGLDVRSIPLDDPQTLGIFSGTGPLGVTPEQLGTTVGTLGIPEFGTEFVRQMLEATRPTVFSELVRIAGLSHGTDVWLNNAADLIREKTATLASVISARDDIMNYLIHKGLDPSLAFKIMESVRKGKGLGPEQEEAMKGAGVPDWYIDSCRKIKYIFPKAHAVAYCMMAFRIAYFKVHHPTAFYANYFSLNAEAFDAEVVSQGPEAVAKQISELKQRQDLTAKEKDEVVVLEVVRESFARGVRFRPVSLQGSDPQLFIIADDHSLLPPLISLSGLGLTCALRIQAERGGAPFRSVEDLARRTGANKNVVEILTRHGCISEMPRTDQVCLF